MSRIAGAKRKQLASHACVAQSLTCMTESEKKNRKEIAQAYETGCINRCKADTHCTRDKPPADLKKTTGRKSNINLIHHKQPKTAK